jgi:hypothetical protein
MRVDREIKRSIAIVVKRAGRSHHQIINGGFSGPFSSIVSLDLPSMTPAGFLNRTNEKIQGIDSNLFVGLAFVNPK